MTGQRRLIRLLSVSLAWLAPPRRALWAQAMQSEIEHIENADDALGFALGCVLACLHQVMGSAVAEVAARMAATLALGAGGVWQLRLFWTQVIQGLSSAKSELLPLSLGISGMLWIGAALALSLWRPRRFTLFGALALCTLAYQQLGITGQIQAYLAGWEGFGLYATAGIYLIAALAIFLVRPRLALLVAVAGLANNVLDWLSLSETAPGGYAVVRALDAEGSVVLIFVLAVAAVFGWTWRRRELTARALGV